MRTIARILMVLALSGISGCWEPEAHTAAGTSSGRDGDVWVECDPEGPILVSGMAGDLCDFDGGCGASRDPLGATSRLADVAECDLDGVLLRGTEEIEYPSADNGGVLVDPSHERFEFPDPSGAGWVETPVRELTAHGCVQVTSPAERVTACQPGHLLPPVDPGLPTAELNHPDDCRAIRGGALTAGQPCVGSEICMPEQRGEGGISVLMLAWCHEGRLRLTSRGFF